MKQFCLFWTRTVLERGGKKNKISQKYWVNLGHGVWSETQCSILQFNFVFSKVRLFNKTSKRLISETPTWSQPLCFENTLEWNVLKIKKEPPVLSLLVLFVFLAKGACQIQPNFVNGLCPSKIKLWSKLLFTAQVYPLYLWICWGQKRSLWFNPELFHLLGTREENPGRFHKGSDSALGHQNPGPASFPRASGVPLLQVAKIPIVSMRN